MTEIDAAAVERVARAIAWCELTDEDRRGGEVTKPEEIWLDPKYLEIAEAAIAALGENDPMTDPNIGVPLASTEPMRSRVRELATPARDDFDRAVLIILDDFDRLARALVERAALAGTTP